jgi:hypothetical protein
MLEACDQAVLVKSLHKPFPVMTHNNSVLYTANPGPRGWADAIEKLLS